MKNAIIRIFSTSILLICAGNVINIANAAAQATQAADAGQSADIAKQAMDISAAGMKLQNMRMKIIAQNIANADIAPANAKQQPYNRQVIVAGTQRQSYDGGIELNSVQLREITEDKAPYIMKYEPYHPAADEKGMVRYPNVNLILEMADFKEAQRSAEASLHAFEISKSNRMRLISALEK